jgi:hypothetical protein
VNSENNKDRDSSLVFYLDGAHSPESMEMCARWFAHITNNDGTQTCSLEQPHTDRDSRKVCITVAVFVLNHISLSLRTHIPFFFTYYILGPSTITRGNFVPKFLKRPFWSSNFSFRLSFILQL